MRKTMRGSTWGTLAAALLGNLAQYGSCYGPDPLTALGYGGYALGGGSPADTWIPEGDNFWGNWYTDSYGNENAQGEGYVCVDGDCATYGF